METFHLHSTNKFKDHYIVKINLQRSTIIRICSQEEENSNLSKKKKSLSVHSAFFKNPVPFLLLFEWSS